MGWKEDIIRGTGFKSSSNEGFVVTSDTKYFVKPEYRDSKQIQNANVQMIKTKD
jgi:hypothetical protein